jgi:hypothetical protein
MANKRSILVVCEHFSALRRASMDDETIFEMTNNCYLKSCHANREFSH